MAENENEAARFEIQDNVLTRYKGLGGVESVTIPGGVTAIADDFFNEFIFTVYGGCKNLTIPSSVTSIGTMCGADALESITVDESNGIYCSIDGVLFNKDKTVLVQYPPGRKGTYSIPYGVTSIGDRAFLSTAGSVRITGLTGIIIPSSVTSIGELAFRLCSGLTSVTIPSSVASIGNGAFSWCHYLASVTIEAGVTSIGDWAFSLCERLTSVTIPSSVTSIGELAFAKCAELTSVTIPPGVTSIGGGAFVDCRGLTSVTIPSSVTSIGDEAFALCERLAGVTFRGGNTLVQSRTSETLPHESSLRKVSGSPVKGDYKPKRGLYLYAQGTWTATKSILVSHIITALTFIIIGACIILSQVPGIDDGKLGALVLGLAGIGCIIGGICGNPVIGAGAGAVLGGLGLGVLMGILGGVSTFISIIAGIIGAVCTGISGGVFGTIATVCNHGKKWTIIINSAFLVVVAAGTAHFFGEDFAGLAKKLGGIESAAVEASAESATAAVTADAANFRAGPSTSTEVLKTLKKGDVLTVIEEAAGGWLHVEHEGKRGYVSAELLSVKESP